MRRCRSGRQRLHRRGAWATGVGGGIVSGGQLLQGRIGNAGHIGHVVVEPDGPPCICGGKGCLETYRRLTAHRRQHEPPSRRRAPAAIVERTGVMVGRALASVGGDAAI